MPNDVGHEIADALGTLLRRSTREQIYRRLTEGLGEAVDEVTYPVLSGLARTGPRSAAGLADEIGLDRSGVTRRATRLEEAGLLRREPDPGDRRATLLALTETGRQAIETTRRRLAAHIEDSLASWPPGEARTFARQLHRFVHYGPFAEER
ncbi:MarR family winged helix-turn-helix transcriptional regulator [Streptomyces antimycoticus]|uniref:MarR family transcriptional regulator n=3 Tax=Streptomyces TaxID=1883 RepID=A0ABD5JJR4_9ACTN|nr:MULTISPECIES: MarR family transcriptional regulator [Streptomyces]MEE4588682.1 MarR family transcriptional regulator [Streptomyces sp. DSM 41602]AJZ84218.1 MarR family transcriptional regulator [Streptomyces sp. AgN23]KUL62218.1 MarR family transcriptional regulator [Streptomyces violaceusniger]RSS44710.1 MarR family transcriptional regulator [Streptomyces sp. WAC05858]WJE01810.1 MarR family transcriptional regulator [Streptomyces antimycoticus]